MSPGCSPVPRKLRHLHGDCVVCYVVQCWLFRLVIFPVGIRIQLLNSHGQTENTKKKHYLSLTMGTNFIYGTVGQRRVWLFISMKNRQAETRCQQSVPWPTVLLTDCTRVQVTQHTKCRNFSSSEVPAAAAFHTQLLFLRLFTYLVYVCIHRCAHENADSGDQTAREAATLAALSLHSLFFGVSMSACGDPG